MDDPLYTLPFIRGVLKEKHKDVCGVALVKNGNRTSVQNNQSKLAYLLSLFIILGPFFFFENVIKTLNHKMRCRLSSYFGFIKSSSILLDAKNMGISAIEIQSPNSRKFQEHLKELAPDVIINQSQNIINKELLSIPKLGVINRHNALLPKNRGRLTPFWVKYKKEAETGVSIHFLTEKIDEGDIIHQEKFSVGKHDTIRKIVKMNYDYAHKAMLLALDKLEAGRTNFIINDNTKASYNTIPSLKDAIRYRLGMKFKLKDN